jgi:adenylate cyclase
LFRTNTKQLRFWSVGALAVVLAFVISAAQVLYSFDKVFSDALYYPKTPASNTIKIIAMDEKTLQEYGNNRTWNRDIWAQLIETLNSTDYDPAVIALDIMFVGENEAASDERFAAACAQAGNVITAVNLIYKTDVEYTGTGISVDKNHISAVEYPYPALAAVSGYGFANTLQDTDGYIRYARTAVTYQGAEIDFLPVAVYKKYCADKGIEPTLPKTFDDRLFAFQYTGQSGAYEVVSMSDVLSGKIDPRAFANSIVFVGAYAAGMQDAYNVPNQKGTQMYGVEIHANILESMMEGKTAVRGSLWWYAVVVTLLVSAFYVACTYLKIVPATGLLFGVIAADVLLCVLLFRNGLVFNLIEFPLFAVLIYVYTLIDGYLTEILRRRKVVSAFKKYVAPQVVEEISRKSDFKIVLGGESRDIAVLFVDIRGFTPMSEKLQPEQVVEILNEYLQLTTTSIFNNGGTLDKFIGDATMAVFNAPFDLDDYIFRAVCTARDIAAGSAALEKKLTERFGRSVSFGIGVNCGRAVVGNIGCEYRMDYTAIGDTVNTAARLESNAKPGQILISQQVYDALKDRIKVTEVGVIPLKGKSNGICVYQLDEIL